MCGIAGFTGPGDERSLAGMLQTLRHRGPDGDGTYIDRDNRIFFAHARLAIIDITGGAQPMADADGRVQVIFNGEIYNHRELRAELIARGHTFRTDHSDTEVLVHGWKEWGAALLLRLNGMFAFVIWDARAKKIFIARDRMGEKPVYYAPIPGGIVFGSELTTVLAHPAVAQDADRTALQKFFAYGFFPAPYTARRAVRKLPAGHWLSFDVGAGSIQTQCFWRFRIDPDESLAGRGIDTLADELRHLFDQAVQRRLESDVPMGVLLSGGIDSSAIVSAVAQTFPPDRIASFSMGFDEASFDERTYAQMMASHVGSNHHVDVCRLEDAKGELPALFNRLDEPIADPSILPTFLVSRFCRRYVTVGLSGDGGDELFAGYDPFLALLPSQIWRALVPQIGDRALSWSVEHLLKSVGDKNMALDFRLRRWLWGLRAQPGAWIPSWMAPFNPAEIGTLFGETLTAEDLYSEAIAAWNDCDSADPADRAMDYFTHFYMQDGILTKTDRAGMLNSLELRAPFLDNDLVAFASRLPRRFKLHCGERKRLLRRAFAGRLPAALLARRKKGFGLPVASWLRTMAMPQARAVPFVDQARLVAMWDDHRQGAADHRLGLWAWMALDAYFGKAHAP